MWHPGRAAALSPAPSFPGCLPNPHLLRGDLGFGLLLGKTFPVQTVGQAGAPGTAASSCPAHHAPTQALSKCAWAVVWGPAGELPKEGAGGILSWASQPSPSCKQNHPRPGPQVPSEPPSLSSVPWAWRVQERVRGRACEDSSTTGPAGPTPGTPPALGDGRRRNSSPSSPLSQLPPPQHC